MNFPVALNVALTQNRIRKTVRNYTLADANLTHL